MNTQVGALGLGDLALYVPRVLRHSPYAIHKGAQGARKNDGTAAIEICGLDAVRSVF